MYNEYGHEKKSSSAAGGITFTGLLQVAFIVLKLCHVIDWSWWWVMAPTWIPIGMIILAVLIAIVWPEKKEKKKK